MLKFSTTEGGTRIGGTEYTTNVTTSGTIGTNDCNGNYTSNLSFDWFKGGSCNKRGYFIMKVTLLILVDKSTQ